ncbi:aKG-HExxH-type peptide beta-hydroxylase [Archangium sp.]|uniref:aKG-HExxH-type peptide beta-hydroxylase n=1 Tax=Archangium sp. TaxID=1872627 RepID=UPI002D742153|nr:HEXXH motif-containing putative peptide modification protein [Archangium sp.]HYO56169.1 HEXXH motif-containing putative peptide modification protein [Archangium sp.]
MMSASRDTAIAASDQSFSLHPEFGDSGQILQRNLARYQFGLEIFSDYLPSLRSLLPKIFSWDEATQRRFFHDPGLRLALEEAFAHLEHQALRPPHPIEGFLADAVDEFSKDSRRTYTEARLSTGSVVGAPREAWIGRFERPEDPRLQALAANFRASTSEMAQCLIPDAQVLERLEQAYGILAAVLPRVGPSALSHISAISLLDVKREEGSLLSGSGGDLVPSTIVISPLQLPNPWDVAGHLLHEGLHLKLFDVVRTQALIQQRDLTVVIPWRAVRFSLVRALFSFHVYAHMLLFKSAVEHADRRIFERYGEPVSYRSRAHAMSVARNDQTAHYGRSLDRAKFLREKLQGEWSPHLTEDGRNLVEWLTGCLDEVEPELRQPAYQEAAV